MDPDELLLRLRHEGLIPGDAVAVALAGSRARGWSHARSDADVVVVTDAPWSSPEGSPRQKVDLTLRTIATEVRTLDGLRTELKYWSAAQVREVLDKVTWDRHDDDPAGDALSTNEWYLLARVPHVLPLVGDEWWRCTAEEVERSAFRSCAALRALEQADSCLEDVAGLWASRSLRPAVLMAGRALDHTVDAFTASLGEAGLETKWRMHRICSVGDRIPLSADRFWELRRTPDDGSVDAWLEEVTHTCQQLMIDVRLGE